ncbi:MAG: hypothetical protein CMLOHMNK_03350 [Steroidobacteraceae bacterium]|nr:hypothetical protein [Steroidobacteraceae bacterium]
MGLVGSEGLVSGPRAVTYRRTARGAAAGDRPQGVTLPVQGCGAGWRRRHSPPGPSMRHKVLVKGVLNQLARAYGALEAAGSATPSRMKGRARGSPRPAAGSFSL